MIEACADGGGQSRRDDERSQEDVRSVNSSLFSETQYEQWPTEVNLQVCSVNGGRKRALYPAKATQLTLSGTQGIDVLSLGRTRTAANQELPFIPVGVYASSRSKLSGPCLPDLYSFGCTNPDFRGAHVPPGADRAGRPVPPCTLARRLRRRYISKNAPGPSFDRCRCRDSPSPRFQVRKL